MTSSKGGISALELQRQLGFRSYGTASARWLRAVQIGSIVFCDRWTWLHKTVP